MANNELEIGRGSGSWEWENNFDRLFIVRNAFSSVCDYRYSCFFLFYFLDESERNGKNPWVQDCYSTPERKDSVPSAVKTAGKYARVWSKAFKCSKKVKKKTLSFLEENKIKGKSANMIQFKSRDKARIKHDKARLRWSHAPFVRLDRPQRDRLRLLVFFLTVTPRSSILEKVPLKETLRSQPFCHGRVSVKGIVLSYRLWG